MKDTPSMFIVSKYLDNKWQKKSNVETIKLYFGTNYTPSSD